MANKYIHELIERDFIYPNNDISIYDVDIVHDIKNSCVSGTVNTFSATTVSSTGITFTANITWSLNNAERFLSASSNTTRILSVHAMGPNQNYYKPWRLVTLANSTLTATTQTSNVTFTIVPSNLEVTSLTNGVYNFEFRFIGKTCVFPVCTALTISTITPAPTATPFPTATAGPATPTPTPTATALACTSGATLNVTDTGWLKYTDCEGVDVYVQYTTTGSKTITDCLQCATIRDGIPFADLATFTVTNCGTSCSATPSPTPTPTTTGGDFYYYSIWKYNCNEPSGPCSLFQTGLVARSDTPLNNGWYYNSSGDGYVYQVQTEITPAPLTYDINLSLAPGNSDCTLACSI
jgi:hypothetical protein